MADWATISSLATAGGTLVPSDRVAELAVILVAAVAERALPDTGAARGDIEVRT